MPAKDESTNESPDEDADDHVPIVVHSQQHDEVGDRELRHVEKRSDELL